MFGVTFTSSALTRVTPSAQAVRLRKRVSLSIEILLLHHSPAVFDDELAVDGNCHYFASPASIQNNQFNNPNPFTRN
jgi:hypothetical protein